LLESKITYLQSAEELIFHVRGCSLNKRESQKAIFSSFYGYAMSICLRYANKQEDATEIVNDGFLKVFREIHRFMPAYSDVVSSFKGWLRKIMICTSIDHIRKFHQYEEATSLEENFAELSDNEMDALDKISYDEIMKAIRSLSPAYRTILNLYIVEGFTHQQIADILKISVGTSKSNLSKARVQLKKILFNSYQIIFAKYETR